MCRVMPLRVEEIEIGEKTLLAAKMTHQCVNTVPSDFFKDQIDEIILC